MAEGTLFEQVVREFGHLAGGSLLHLDFRSGDVDEDLGLLHQMIDRGERVPGLRLWRRPQSLVTSPRLARMEGFADAAHWSAVQGWPVVVRASAGLTVAHRPGILNISQLETLPEGALMGAPYDGLLRRLKAVCARFGVQAGHGAVPGSYCDGTQNLTVAGRKLAGLSARLVSRGGRRGLMVHACLTIEGDVAGDVAAVSAFERRLGLPAAYSAKAHCSLADCVSNCETKRSLTLDSGAEA